MADADEDVIPRSGPLVEDADLSEETQDFRFLANISGEDAKIPKRGEKDFEPHATVLQSDTLAASRQAMHNALAFQRVHPAKGRTTAVYHPESNMAYAHNPKGPLFAKMGQVLPAEEDPFGDDGHRGHRMWFLPEEIIFLIERGTVDVRWPPFNQDGQGDVALPMSLQAAYAMFIGDGESQASHLTFGRYSVYSGLKRMGYTVHRASTFGDGGPLPSSDCFAPPPKRTWQAGLLSLAHSLDLFRVTKNTQKSKIEAEGPLVPPALYRGYREIYRRLAIISYHDPTSIHFMQDPTPQAAHSLFRVTYNVWKPGSPNYKKSAPGPPDFRIAVVNARETDVPTLHQLSRLMDTVPYDPPREADQLYQKLKHGYKNVIIAIVDQGVVSYLRIADAAFGHEKLYDRAGKGPSRKRGGGRGGRGRGR